MDFLVLKRIGPAQIDLEVCALIEGKKGEEDGEIAIREAVGAGEAGDYIAIPFDEETATRRRAIPTVDLENLPTRQEEAAVAAVEKPARAEG